VVLVPRDSTADPARIAGRVAQAVALPFITVVPLAQVVDGSSGPLIMVHPGEDPERGPATAALEALNHTAHEINAFSKATADPAAFTAEWTPQLLAPVAGALIPAQTRSAQAESVVEAASQLVKSVSAIDGSEVTMISATSELPVVIENSSPLALDFTVALTTSAKALVTDGTVALSLEPETRATVRVPVHAIANGDVEVTVRLLNDDGEPVGAASTFAVRVHAEWESIGTGIFLALIGLLLVVGLVRAITRRRTGRGAAPSSGEESG
jgi:hypothetical protein